MWINMVCSSHLASVVMTRVCKISLKALTSKCQQTRKIQQIQSTRFSKGIGEILQQQLIKQLLWIKKECLHVSKQLAKTRNTPAIFTGKRGPSWSPTLTHAVAALSHKNLQKKVNNRPSGIMGKISQLYTAVQSNKDESYFSSCKRVSEYPETGQ